MIDQILPLILVLSVGLGYIALWKRALQRRELLKDKIVLLLQDDKFSTTTKKKFLMSFLMSGDHFVIAKLAWWTLKELFSSDSEICEHSKNEVEEFDLDNSQTVFSSIIKEAVLIVIIMSPVQFFIGSLILIVTESIKSLFFCNSKQVKPSMKKSTASILMHYTEHKI